MRYALLVIIIASCQDSQVSRELGAECTSDKDCDGVCATGGNYPDGMCTQRCAVDLDCPSGSACVSDMGGVCLFRCSIPGDCTFMGPQWTCEDSTCHGS